jgi:hypothetical protein
MILNRFMGLTIPPEACFQRSMSMPETFCTATPSGGSRSGVIPGLLAAMGLMVGCSPAASQTRAPSARPPKEPVRLVFVHHSCGENWLADSNGGLGKALAENNYFVSDTNYGWGPNGIGDRTDITDWPEWFLGPRSREYTQALYRESGQHCEYARTGTDPGGENRIVMFKSCFPNSNLKGRPSDEPARGDGLSVANAKAIYNELLKYFAKHPDRLFVVVTAPPVQDRIYARNARALNRWLVQDWLAGYRGNNVAVFDFYNVLTDPKNHHRVRDGKIEYTCEAGRDTLYFPTDGDDHPSAAGNRKATEEFVPLLNAYYQKWAATKPAAATAQTTEPPADMADRVMPVGAPASTDTPPDEPAVATAAGKTIDDFEREPRAWATFLDETKDTRLTFAADKETKHNGAASLRIQYDLAPESWATCSLVYDRPQDWNGSQGLSFYVHVEKSGQPLTVVAYGGKSGDDLLHFEQRFTAGQAAVDGWQRIDVPWSRLKLPEWQGDATQKYNPRSAMGFAIAFDSPVGGRRAGTLWIDDVALVADKSAGETGPATTPR